MNSTAVAVDQSVPPAPPPQAVNDNRDPTVADLMTPPVGVFPPETTVAQAIERLREEVKTAFVTYLYLTRPDGKLVGLVVMREMLLASPDTKLEQIMLADPFTLERDQPLDEALKSALYKHFPVYPVVDAQQRLVGLVRGPELFANRAIEISAQAGAMVGVEKEERLDTPLFRSLLLRHPWLQVNLLTAFVAAAVVGVFEGTLSRLVILAVFLPVMAGQTGNTGCQALAVTLRGMTLGDVKPGSQASLVRKEGMLGFFNGALVGVTAGLGMYIYAVMQGEAGPAWFGFVVFVSMIGACTASGIAGAMIPLTLKRLGADPATASSIFLTTASDVTSMGIFLTLATILL